jgi:cytochrome c oxidase cbb3-type subunit II
MASDGREEWLPTLQRFPSGWGTHPRQRMLMTPLLIFLGGIFAFAVPTIVAAFFQMMFFTPAPSGQFAPLAASAYAGRQIFVANGCLYCHSGYTRPQDVREGLYYLYPRVSLPGDFVTSDDSPNLFGTARIGPDLSQESGYHPDDWQNAHFSDPRYVDPLSIMPSFNFLTNDQVTQLHFYLQTRSGKDGLLRYAGQLYMKKAFLVATGYPPPPVGFDAEKLTLDDVAAINDAATPPDGDVNGVPFPDAFNLFATDRSYWLSSNPLPVTTDNLVRGRVTFQERCIGCHGSKGDAISEAARFLRPTPIGFDSADDASTGNDTSPGDLYFRVLRGIQGTAMENFGTRLRVDDIWRVVLFLKVIPNGGLDPNKVPTPDMYIQWAPTPEVNQLVAANPIGENQNFLDAQTGGSTDPFMLEAQRDLAGANIKTKFDMPGFGEVSLTAARDAIKAIYDQLLAQGYNDYQARGGTPALSAQQRAVLPQFTRDLR